MKAFEFSVPTSTDTKTFEISQKVKMWWKIAGTIFYYSSLYTKVKKEKNIVSSSKSSILVKKLADFKQFLPISIKCPNYNA